MALVVDAAAGVAAVVHVADLLLSVEAACATTQTLS